jgi:hypothetical protein
MGSVPDQPPDATQLVAPVVLQIKVEVPPAGMAAGFAANVIAGGGITVTLAVCDAFPPVPEHAREKFVDVSNVPVD